MKSLLFEIPVESKSTNGNVSKYQIIHYICHAPSLQFLDFSTFKKENPNDFPDAKHERKTSRFPAKHKKQSRKKIFISFHKDFVQTGQDQRTVNRQQVTSVFFIF